MTALTNWRDRASCRTGVDPEIFFPLSPKPEFAREALAVCATCPVREECLAWSLKHRISNGIWGGLTEDERRGVRLAQAAA
jgi:WhiB family redox-sensing transcriptional regulator